MRGEVCGASLRGGLSSVLAAPPEIPNAIRTPSTTAATCLPGRLRPLAQSSCRCTPSPLPENHRAQSSTTIGSIRRPRRCRRIASSASAVLPVPRPAILRRELRQEPHALTGSYISYLRRVSYHLKN